MQDYKKLTVWVKAHSLTLEVYRITKNYPKDETFGITSQLRRAVASIPANISEGCGRNSSADFANFLNYSLGSANETSYFLLLSKDLGYISEDNYIISEDKIEMIKAMLISLIDKVRIKK
jgi:four helix bundle protein